jgi:hypothetical protein
MGKNENINKSFTQILFAINQFLVNEAGVADFEAAKKKFGRIAAS